MKDGKLKTNAALMPSSLAELGERINQAMGKMTAGVAASVPWRVQRVRLSNGQTVPVVLNNDSHMFSDAGGNRGKGSDSGSSKGSPNTSHGNSRESSGPSKGTVFKESSKTSPNVTPAKPKDAPIPKDASSKDAPSSKDGTEARDGKTEGTGEVHPNGTPNPTHNAKGERIDNVEVPKVKFTSITEYMKQEDIANNMYTNFKTMKNDISDIAKNTGWKEADIQQINNHLFIEKHKFDNGQVKSFDPNYQQAMAWGRLMQGNYNKNDILFLNHEFFESNYMKKHGATYEQGHAEAQKYYNWSDTVFED